MSSPGVFTVWRLRQIPGRGGLDIQIVIDTTAESVIETIEQAARDAGIELERVVETPPT